MKCTKSECGAEIADGQKFCGDCGTSAPEPMTKAICPNEHENPASAKFCGECAEPLAPALAAEFQKDLGAVEALAKAQLPTSLAFVDPADLGEGDEDPEELVEALLKGQGAGQALEGVDGVTVLEPEALLKSINGIVAANSRALLRTVSGAFDVLGAEILKLRAENHVLAKAQGTNMRSLSALETGPLAAITEHLEKIGAVRLPRRAHITALVKSTTAEKVEGKPDGDTAADDKSLRGEPLLKALCVAAERGKHSGLSEHDVGMIQHFANRGWSADMIAKNNPDLGARLNAAITPNGAGN